MPASYPSRDVVFNVDYFSSAVWVFAADGSLTDAGVGWLPVGDELRSDRST